MFKKLFGKDKTKKTVELLTEGREPCVQCGAMHSEDNRVNWWDSSGIPHGPNTRKDWHEPMCDRCAEAYFENIQGILSGLEFKDLTNVYDSEMQQLQTLYESALESENRLKTTFMDYIKDWDKIVVKHKDKTIGFIIFRLNLIDTNSSRLYLEFSDIYVSEEFRGMGIAQKLVYEMIDRLSNTSFEYLIPEHTLSPSVEELFTSRFFEKVENKHKEIFVFKE